MKTILIILLSLVITNSYSQEIITIGESFNYNIGDEFQYTSDLENQPPNAVKHTVINKYFSINNDTIFYVLSRFGYSTDVIWNPQPHLEYSFYTDTIIVNYTNLNLPVFDYYVNLRYDSILVNYNDTTFVYDSIVDYSSEYCNVLLNGFTCYLGYFEPNYYECNFGKGIGITKYVEGAGGVMYPIINYRLFYFKKDTVICGTPDLTTIIDDNKQLIENIIYPNPTNNIVTINITNYNYSFSELQIYNSLGLLINRKIITEPIFKTDFSQYQNGLYLVKIIMDKIEINTKVLKE